MASIKKWLARWVVGAVVVAGAGLAATSAIAQTDLTPFESTGTDDDGVGVFGDTSDPFELIHRAILSPTMSSEEFLEQQNRNIGSEALNFRLLQQERLRQQAAPVTEEPEGVTVDDASL